MSHIVTIRTQIRDPLAIAAACQRLQLPAPVQRTVRLFSAEANGLAIELPGLALSDRLPDRHWRTEIRQFRGALGKSQ